MRQSTGTAQHLIRGQWVGPGDAPVHSPVDGRRIGRVARADTTLAIQAADAAATAFDSWSHTSTTERVGVLTRAAELLRDRREKIDLLLALETGKRRPEAHGEVGLAAEYLQWFAEELRRPHGEVIPSETSGRRKLTIARPAGVVAALTPWNFPVSIPARKLAALLAAGCTAVCRVSGRAPLAATEFIRTLGDAGLPDGAINLVHGPAETITDALLEHPAVRVVTFTGSTEVGRAVMAKASGRVVEPLLELGGNAPFIVCADADLDAAVDGAVAARTRNTGQSCIAANRFFAHCSVAEEFEQRFAERLDAMSVGNPVGEAADAPEADLGPLIDEQAAARVADLVDRTVASGGRLLTRRRPVPADGNYLAPALVATDRDDVPLMEHEVFGPAAAVATFSDLDDVIARANGSEMGLAAYVFAESSTIAWRMSEQLEAGIIGVNDPLPTVVQAPMGGIKQSGIGREGSRQGIEEFLELRQISWRA